jgi:hypothetical protein
MAIQVTSIDGMGAITYNGSTYSTTGMTDNDHMQVSIDFVGRSGVVQTTNMAVAQNGTPNRSVNVAAGTLYIDNPAYAANSNSETRYWRIVNDATVNVSVNANSSGNPRYSSIFAKLDTSATPDGSAANLASFVSVDGTAAASPTPPSAPADGNAYLRLADVYLANGYTTITTSVITDKRVLVYLTDYNSDLYGGTFGSGLSRQGIVNSNFNIWQRGTSFSSSSDQDYIFTADHWAYWQNDGGGTLPTVTYSRQALTAGDLYNSYYFFRMAPNGAGTSLGAASYGQLTNYIEHGSRFMCGLDKRVTISFYARSSIANKKLGVYMVQSYGSGGSPSSSDILNGTNWTLTSSWVKYTYTFTTATLVGKTFGTANDDSLQVAFTEMWGSSRISYVNATAAETFVGSGNIDIAQVQVCAGDVALPYQPQSYVQEQRDCFRYYRRVGAGLIGRWNSASACEVGCTNEIKLRKSPVVALLTSTPTIIELGVGPRTGSGSAIASTTVNATGATYVSINGFSGASTGGIALGSTDEILELDAEI